MKVFPKIMITASCFISVLFPINIAHAAAMPEETAATDMDDDGSHQETAPGWKKKSGQWFYYDAAGRHKTGWQYLPEKNNPQKYRWYYFDTDGSLFSDYLMWNDKDEKDMPVTVYTGAIPFEYMDFIEYDRGAIEEGWHEVSFAGDDSSARYYIKSYGMDKYTIRRFSDGLWTAADAADTSVQFKTENGKDSQKWTVIKNPDRSFSFINIASGIVLGKNADGMYISAYNDTNRDQKIFSGPKLVVTPQFYGAIGDGVSDDTEALRLAINDNDEVVFDKRYNTTEPIYINRDGVTLRGEGGMIFTHPGFQTFRLKGKNVTFDSLIFKGSYTREETTDNSCIFIKTERDEGAYVDFNTKIINCGFIETGLRGVHIHSERISDKYDFTPISIAGNITVKDCLFDTYKIGVCCSGPDNVTVENCTFSNGFFEHITFDWRSRYCKAVNNHFLSGENGIGAIGLDSAENIEITNNEFTYTNLYGVTFNNEAGKSSNVVISGNTFKNGGGRGGIYMVSESGRSVAAENVVIKDNIFKNDNSESVLVNSAIGELNFSGNRYDGKTPNVTTTQPHVIKDY